MHRKTLRCRHQTRKEKRKDTDVPSRHAENSRHAKAEGTSGLPSWEGWGIRDLSPHLPTVRHSFCLFVDRALNSHLLNVLCEEDAMPPCVTFRRVVVSLRGPEQSPVLPFACCVGSLLSVARCSRCSRPHSPSRGHLPQ